nr:putative uncharacterized protein C5orf66 homolog isoform X10 [Macaca nemestrina]
MEPGNLQPPGQVPIPGLWGRLRRQHMGNILRLGSYSLRKKPCYGTVAALDCAGCQEGMAEPPRALHRVTAPQLWAMCAQRDTPMTDM